MINQVIAKITRLIPKNGNKNIFGDFFLISQIRKDFNSFLDESADDHYSNKLKKNAYNEMKKINELLVQYEASLRNIENIRKRIKPHLSNLDRFGKKFQNNKKYLSDSKEWEKDKEALRRSKLEKEN